MVDAVALGEEALLAELADEGAEATVSLDMNSDVAELVETLVAGNWALVGHDDLVADVVSVNADEASALRVGRWLGWRDSPSDLVWRLHSFPLWLDTVFCHK